MEQFIKILEGEALDRGVSPQSMIKRAVGFKWSTWRDWKSGKSSPTLATVDRIYAWMAANPPSRCADARSAVTQ